MYNSYWLRWMFSAQTLRTNLLVLLNWRHFIWIITFWLRGSWAACFQTAATDSTGKIFPVVVCLFIPTSGSRFHRSHAAVSQWNKETKQTNMQSILTIKPRLGFMLARANLNWTFKKLHVLLLTVKCHRRVAGKATLFVAVIQEKK